MRWISSSKKDEGRTAMPSSTSITSEVRNLKTSQITEAPTRFNRRSLPIGVLGMLALICGVESTIMRYDFDLTTLVASNWQIEGKAPARYAAKTEILCFGDSMVKFGVQPRVLGPSLGRSVYNFALYCGPPQTSYYQLQRAFQTGAKPAAVLVDFQPEILMCDAMRVTSRTFPEILGFPELFDLCWTAGDFDHLAEFFAARLLPSSRKRFEIRAAFTAAISGQSASLRDRLIAVKRNWKVNGGAEVLSKNPYFHGEVPDTGAYPSMFWTPWNANKLSVVYLERFLNLAAEHQVPVFWLLQPNAPEVHNRREQTGYDAQYESFVRGYLEHYPQLTIIDGRHVRYPSSFFTDPVHLDRSGSTAYSLGIADVLRPFLESGKVASRWEKLPDRRERADEVALEDHGQSAVAIQAKAISDTAKLRR